MSDQRDSGTSLAKRILRTVRWTFAGLLVVLLVIRITGIAEQLAYWPSRTLIVTPHAYEDVWIETPDGVKLHAWFMPAIGFPEGQRAPAILHVHGNAGNIADHESFSDFLTNAGFHVLLFDYRCYGRSDDKGPINRPNLAIDTKAALEILFNRPDVDSNRVGVLGVSLGGSFAMNAAGNDHRVKAIATLSAFSSWNGVAADMSILGPFLLANDPGYDPIKAVNFLNNQPYLIMHGLDDEVINPRHADLLYKQARHAGVDVTLAKYPGDHNNLIQTTSKARQDLIAFFQAKLETAVSKMDEDPMFKSKTHTPKSFWKWFNKYSDELLTLDGEQLLNKVSPQITKYHEGLVALVSSDSSLPREFIISADGFSDNVDAVESLVNAAPEIPNWKIIRFRPRFSNAGNGIRIGEVKVNTNAVQFVAFRDGSKIGVEIYAHWRKPEDGTDADGPAFIMLDHTIGEYDVICGIGIIEVHPLENAPENARPWSEFAETFDRVFHKRDANP